MLKKLLKSSQRFLKGSDNATVKMRQKVLMFGVVGLGMGLVLMIIFGGEDKKQNSFKKETLPKKVDIQSGGKRVNPQDVWRFKQEDQTKDIKHQVNTLQSLLENLVQDKKEKEKEAAEKMALLEEQLREANEKQQQKSSPSRERDQDEGGFGDSFDHPDTGFDQGFRGPRGPMGGIQKISLPLSGDEGLEKEAIKTVDNTIPAGSFAKAVLLAGVDASTAMNAVSDPRPMLLRIVDPGSLPRRFKSDLKDCRCTASTYGDISSERVYVRLEKLTCIERETGEVVETQVAGYVAGSDGRAGIRGKVVSKDAAYLGRGLVSGVLGGLAAMTNPNQTPNLTLGLGTSTVETPSKGELFTSGMSKGTSSAMDRLSGYYIDRAEQLQPVVQVGAGQFVDIIFTEGVSIGDTNVKREISKVRDAARLKIAQKVSINPKNDLRRYHG